MTIRFNWYKINENPLIVFPKTEVSLEYKIIRFATQEEIKLLNEYYFLKETYEIIKLIFNDDPFNCLYEDKNGLLGWTSRKDITREIQIKNKDFLNTYKKFLTDGDTIRIKLYWRIINGPPPLIDRIFKDILRKESVIFLIDKVDLERNSYTDLSHIEKIIITNKNER